MAFSGWQSGPIISYRFVGVLYFPLSFSFDLHTVIIYFSINDIPHEMPIVGRWFFIRCPCVRVVWPILSQFIILSVFFKDLNCGQRFKFCFILCNLVFWYDQWCFQTLCVINFMCFLCLILDFIFVWGTSIYLLLYFCLLIG